MSIPTTCPHPETLSPLRSSGWTLQFERLPGISYFIQSTSLPDVSLGFTTRASSVHDVKVPGEALTFGSLTVTFQVDEKMKNYLSLLEWMFGLGFPMDNIQYSKTILENDSTARFSESSKAYSDAVLTVLGSNNRPVKQFRIVDAFPVNLSGADFDSRSDDADVVAVTATFEYAYFYPEA